MITPIARVTVFLLAIHIFCVQDGGSFYYVDRIDCNIEDNENSVSDNSVLALLDIYDTLGGSLWNSNSNWLIGDPCNNFWFGVVCSGGSITEINLEDNNLSGILGENNGFCELPFLVSLNISDNNVSGVLPSCLFTSTMEELDLSDNAFSGSLPESMSTVQSSLDLRLTGNLLDGCYINALNPKCSDNSFTNSRISDGNNFDATWSEYCLSGDGVCCELDYEIDLAVVESGTYYAKNTILLNGNLDASKSILLKAPKVIFESQMNTNSGSIDISNNGCDQN